MHTGKPNQAVFEKGGKNSTGLVVTLEDRSGKGRPGVGEEAVENFSQRKKIAKESKGRVSTGRARRR